MSLKGTQFIGFGASSSGDDTFQVRNPATGEALPVHFHEATSQEVDDAAQAADGAFDAYRNVSSEKRAGFLDTIADEILALGDELVMRAMAESGLPRGRIEGERGRTVGQLRLFASLLRDGDWEGRCIEEALPDREPLPRPDLRRRLIGIGPVAVFGASNFPLAFSTAGGDTASALAAGCPVIVKGHPAHAGTGEYVAHAVLAAAEKTGMPEGVFSLVQGTGHELGSGLVGHPLVKAVGFTGSLAGGRALFDLAASRPEPIPVYAEMGSCNPVFIFPEALSDGVDGLVDGLTGSISLGVGQFCTSPGLLFLIKGPDSDALVAGLTAGLDGVDPAVMLHAGIRSGYDAGVLRLSDDPEVVRLTAERDAGEGCLAVPALFKVSSGAYHADLEEEVFGPASLVVECDSVEDMVALAEGLHGHLTATIHSTAEAVDRYGRLIQVLERKAGRLIFNGYPTGVEVCHAMTHGGPYPATTDSRTTSVGTAAINRFLRPVTYQSFPVASLPESLRDA